MRNLLRNLGILVTSLTLVIFMPMGEAHADSGFQIRLDQSIENAVFTLTYQGPVKDMSLISPAGFEIQSEVFPGSYCYDEGTIRIGVRTAELGRWGIEIIGEPEDGFQLVVTSDSSFTGSFCDASNPSVSVPTESEEAAQQDPVTETDETTAQETSASSSQTESSQNASSSDLVDPSNNDATEKSYEKETRQNEANVAVISETDQTESKPTVQTEEAVLIAKMTYSEATTQKEREVSATLQSEAEGVGQDKTNLTNGSSEQTGETSMLALFGATNETNNVSPPSLEKGIAVYLGVFLPVVLSIVVFLMELRTKNDIRMKQRYRQEKNHSSFRKRPPTKGEEPHDDSLWRTSTWQAPSQPM